MGRVLLLPPEFLEDDGRPFPVLVGKLGDAGCKDEAPEAEIQIEEDDQQQDSGSTADQRRNEDRYLVIRHDEACRDGMVGFQYINDQHDKEHRRRHERSLAVNEIQRPLPEEEPC